MKRLSAKAVCVLTAAFLFSGTLSARDINLDTIYISSRSVASIHLMQTKLDEFFALEASMADSGVAFAGWSSGDSVVYAKDLDTSFDVYEYVPGSRNKRKIGSFSGTIVYATMTRDGRFFFAKSLEANGTAEPVCTLRVIQVRNGAVIKYSAREIFVDFSITPSGRSWIREERSGICEYSLDAPLSSPRVILHKENYRRFLSRQQNAIPFLSTDSSRIALITGGGGQYHGVILENGSKIAEIESLSSPSEFAWLSSTQIAYRSGSPGSYRLLIRSLSDGKVSVIGSYTMNTNLSWSPQNRIISFLQDGCISFYDTENHTTETYPVEGEDISFAPNGNSFCLLYGGRLLIVKREKMKKKILEMKRVASQIAQIYRGLVTDTRYHENGYSALYAKRKEELYLRLAR